MKLAVRARGIPGVAPAKHSISGMMTTERDLAIAHYDSQTARAIVERLPEVSQHELRMIATYERTHKDRAGVRRAVARRMAA